MASTGINDGGIARLSIGGTVVTHLINCSFNYSHEPREVTTKTSSAGAKEYKPGLTGWTMSGECFMAEDAAYGRTDIETLITNRTLVQCKYGSTVSGDLIYKGDAYITALNSTSGNQGENETFSVEIQGTGTLTKQTLT